MNLEEELLSLKDMFPAALENKLVEWNAKHAKLSLLWAESNAEFKSMSDRKNDILAKLTHQAEGKSNVEKERNARLSDEWENYRLAVATLGKKTLSLKVKYDISIRTYETIRSLLSSKNCERRFT